MSRLYMEIDPVGQSSGVPIVPAEHKNLSWRIDPANSILVEWPEQKLAVQPSRITAERFSERAKKSGVKNSSETVGGTLRQQMLEPVTR